MVQLTLFHTPFYNILFILKRTPGFSDMEICHYLCIDKKNNRQKQMAKNAYYLLIMYLRYYLLNEGLPQLLINRAIRVYTISGGSNPSLSAREKQGRF